MTITHAATGSLATHTDTVTPALPAGTSAGQLAVLVVVSGSTTDSTPSAPSGWSAAGSDSGGGGTFGASAGPRRVTYYARTLTGSDSDPTTSIPSGDTGSLIAARILVLSTTGTLGWRWTVAFAEDTTSGTSFSAASATTPTWAAGDFVVLGYGLAGSTASVTAEAIAATGITYGTVTERADDAVTDGHGARLGIATCTESSGADTQAPTVSATLAAATTGAAGVLRVREASSAVTVSAQSADPPRNLVSVTGLMADDIVTATVYRQVDTTLTAVRAATDVDVTGSDVLLRVDAEQPFGISLTYAAYLTDVTGATWIAYSGAITSTVTGDVISDAIRGVGAHVTITRWDDKKRSREAALFSINGRLVVVGKKRSGAQSVVTVSTEAVGDGDALQDILDNATEGIIQIRARNTVDGIDGHLALLMDDERRLWYTPRREWDLETAETEAWPDVLEAAGFTLQDIADNFSTLQDLADAFPGTLLDIAQNDFGS